MAVGLQLKVFDWVCPVTATELALASGAPTTLCVRADFFARKPAKNTFDAIHHGVPDTNARRPLAHVLPTLNCPWRLVQCQSKLIRGKEILRENRAYCHTGSALGVAGAVNKLINSFIGRQSVCIHWFVSVWVGRLGLTKML